MANIKLVLMKAKETPLGLQPIYIRIIIDRKARYISTGHYIRPQDFNETDEIVKSSHPMHREINEDIIERKREVMGEVVTGMKGRQLSSRAVKQRIVSKAERTNLFTYAESYISKIQHKRKPGTIKNYRKHLHKLELFTEGPLSFEEINHDFLNKFEAWIRVNTKTHEGRNPNNYIHAIMKTLRMFINAAIKEGLTNHYPFTNYEMPEATTGDKDHFTLKELDKLEKYADSPKSPRRKREATIYFLFGCYTGLRVSDWYAFSSDFIKQNDLSQKATKNRVWVNVPLHDRLKRNLARMKKVPLKLHEQKLNDVIKLVAEDLGIKKRLTTHCARKTFAVTMCLERGISSETAAQLMGINLATFVKSYSRVTPEKVRLETERAWKGL